MVSEHGVTARDPAAEHFPVFSNEEYDFSFKRHAWPIGLKSTYPEELIRRVGAAVASYQAGNSAIDYTYKRYFKDHAYPMNDGSRLDLRIGREIKHKMELLSEVVFQISSLEPKKEGQFISEWTFLRIPFSVKFLLSCANRGALFESAAIARMILEQVAWSNAVDGFDDFSRIQSTSATKAIGALKAKFAAVGRLYGWLSVHAHWAYDGHVKAMHLEGGLTSTLLATSKFKASSLALTILLSVLSIKAFSSIRETEVAKLLKDAAPSQTGDAWSVRGGNIVPSSVAMCSLTDFTRLSELIVELASHYPGDIDIADLSQIVVSELSGESNEHG